MTSRHQPLNGADSAQSLADAIALLENAGFYVYPNSTAISPSCIACSEPALPNNLYCQGHDRLGTYRVTDEKHWAANE
jgi:hypothetical protein